MMWTAVFFFSLLHCSRALPNLRERTKRERKGWPRSRRERFPNVEERVRLYMSNWYLPSCQQKESSFAYRPLDESRVKIVGTNMTLSRDVTPDRVLWLKEEVVLDCARYDVDVDTDDSSAPYRVEFRKNMRMYCTDVVEVFDIVTHLDVESMPPVLAQFGDMRTSHEWGIVTIPHLKKFRSAAATPESLHKVTGSSSSCVKNRVALQTGHSQDSVVQPIVWKMATHRHYRHLPNVHRHDTPWDEKRDVAVWRGQLTGSIDYGYNKTATAMQNCQNLPRCKLVYDTAKSPYVDAKLTNLKGRLPDVLDGVELVGPSVTIRELMRHKGIVMVEGNDVASGLKWALLSQSVVLMPKPKYTSWAMEELLQPWVHYIPLKDDITDVVEKMKWIVDNKDEARAIAERGTIWMEDLVFHPEASRDDRLIKEEILRRYSAHFRAA